MLREEEEKREKYEWGRRWSMGDEETEQREEEKVRKKEKGKSLLL